MKKISNEISKISEMIFDIGDRDECSIKNLTNGFLSIYFYNDLNHFIDYSSNCHTDEDSEKFVNYWKDILDKVKHLNIQQRKNLMGMFIDKDSHFYDLHIDIINQNKNWFSGLE